MTITRCNYCDDILNYHSNKSPCNEVLLESNSYVVTTSLGAFIEGWTLLISKRHVTSMSQLSLPEIEELDSLIYEIRKTIETNYGPSIVFEHGALTPGTNFGCGIDHAHVHIVPFEDSILPILNKELPGIRWQELGKLEDITLERRQYLFVIDKQQQNGLVSNPEEIPSQFMRRVIAKYLGIPEYFDYHKYSFDEKSSATCNTLRRALKSAIVAGY